MINSDKEMHFSYEVLDKLMSLPFEVDEDVAYRVAFHMSDWGRNLTEITEVLSGNFESEDQCFFSIMGFSFRFPEHVAKAKEMFALLK